MYRVLTLKKCLPVDQASILSKLIKYYLLLFGAHFKSGSSLIPKYWTDKTECDYCNPVTTVF